MPCAPTLLGAGAPSYPSVNPPHSYLSRQGREDWARGGRDSSLKLRMTQGTEGALHVHEMEVYQIPLCCFDGIQYPGFYSPHLLRLLGKLVVIAQ